MGRYTTIEQRELVLNDYRNGKSVQETENCVNQSAFNTQHIIERSVRENRDVDKTEKIEQ